MIGAGTSAFRDGVQLGTTGDCRGVPVAERTAMYVGGSTCMGAGVYSSDFELAYMGLWNRELLLSLSSFTDISGEIL